MSFEPWGEATKRISATERLFVQRMKIIRSAVKLSQIRLSAMLDGTGAMVTRIENGHRARIGLGEAAEICRVLGVPLEGMLNPDEPLDLLIETAQKHRASHRPARYAVRR